MLFDIEESPKLKMLKIDGRLTFDDRGDRTLRAEHIFVESGELLIGSNYNYYVSQGYDGGDSDIDY